MTMGKEEYNYRMSLLVDAIVVHQTSMREALIAQGVDGQRIHVIPHGTEILGQVDARKARSRLGLPEDGRIILSFGFFVGRKNMELLIDALPLVLQEVPDAYLFVSGYVREWIREDLEMREFYEERAEQLGVRDRVIFAKRYIPDNETTWFLTLWMLLRSLTLKRSFLPAVVCTWRLERLSQSLSPELQSSRRYGERYRVKWHSIPTARLS